MTRCATIVGCAPPDAEGLDNTAGKSPEELEEWRCVESGEDCIVNRLYPSLLEWVEALASDRSIAQDEREMLVQAFREGLAPGPGGLVDDYACLHNPWEFDVGTVRLETRVMVARDDTSVPPTHGEWLVNHLTNAELIVVGGGHFGARDQEEEELLAWCVG